MALPITRMSARSASSRPPATATPSMAAMIGLEKVIRLGPRAPSPSGVDTGSSSTARDFRSQPEQKLSPTPQITATEMLSSASKSRNACFISAAVGMLMAFFTSGRLMMTVITGPSDSTMSVITGVLCCADSIRLLCESIALDARLERLREQSLSLLPIAWHSRLM